MPARIAMGNIGGGEYGLLVSKPGHNVLTAEPGNLLFDSRMKFLQILQQGTFTMPAASTVMNVVITNPTGRTPLAWVGQERTYFGGRMFEPAFWARRYSVTLSPTTMTVRKPGASQQSDTFAYVIFTLGAS